MIDEDSSAIQYERSMVAHIAINIDRLAARTYCYESALQVSLHVEVMVLCDQGGVGQRHQ